jgi:tripartite-type tricarboxylate transporter receptor subunit TctC
MKLVDRRALLHLGAAAGMLPALSHSLRAETYPSRPVRLLVGFAAGGITDILARLISQSLSERLGQQFIVENRVGAGSNLATEAVAKSPPDGYTLLQISAANAINTTLYRNLNFDLIRDIVPIAAVMRVPGVMVVHPSVPALTVPEFITYAKSNPGKINMASGGNGSTPHIYGELFKMMAGVDLLHVPYRGGAPALIDLLSGQVHVMFDTLPTSLEHIRTHKLRPLAVTTMTRVEVLPEVPTVGDFCRATKQAAGRAWERQRALLAQLLIGSMRKLIRHSMA